jgi:general L-amino acid transport system permease protein
MTLSALWRNPKFRSILSQVVSICALFSVGYVIFRNTTANMAKRGISSGLQFLKDEAGFGISEVLPIPQLEGGFLYLVLTIFFGVMAVFALSRWAAARGKKIGQDNRLFIISILLIFVLPGTVLYITGYTFRTITYSETCSYGMALITGILNTIKLSIMGCILITFLGFFIGIARLSSNWLVSKMATVYVETLRNIPVLLQILFWYFAIVGTLPGVKSSIKFWNYIILNNRGVIFPEPSLESGFLSFIVAIFVSFIAIRFLITFARLKQDTTGQQLPVFYLSIAIIVGLSGFSILFFGAPISFSYPVLRGFNYVGGITLSPEFTALLVALVIYTSAYVAEIVRSGIQAISREQIEAGLSLGFKRGKLLRLIILPQAVRVIIPPLISQYISLIKDSSLGMVIAYPELISVSETIIHQTGQVVEVMAITMSTYLILNIIISLILNWYNAKTKLVER